MNANYRLLYFGGGHGWVEKGQYVFTRVEDRKLGRGWIRGFRQGKQEFS
jgi:hypothetical protein